MLITSSLSKYILSSPAKLPILTTLIKWQGTDLTERQLAKLCQLSTFGLRHALADLERSLIVTKKTVGRANVWSLNKSSFAYGALISVIEQLANLPRPIEEIVRRIRSNLGQPEVERILLFGSVLHEEDEIGDIDICVLIKKGRKESTLKEKIIETASKLSGELGPAIGKRLEPHVFTSEEWSKTKKTTLGKSILKGKEIYPHEEI